MDIEDKEIYEDTSEKEKETKPIRQSTTRKMKRKLKVKKKIVIF